MVNYNQEKSLPRIIYQFKDTIQDWILNHPNVIGSSNGNYFIKIAKRGFSNKYYVQFVFTDIYQC